MKVHVEGVYIDCTKGHILIGDDFVEIEGVDLTGGKVVITEDAA